MNYDDNKDERTAHDLAAVAAQLVEAACRARAGDRDAARAHIAHAVAMLGATASPGPRSIPTLPNSGALIARGGLPAWQTRKVFAHVEANIAEKIHVHDLARLIGLSASHFCRSFKSTLGVSPREYLLRRRIEVAKDLMLTTSEPLSAIAAQCGMCDQSHFTRSFHRLVGETPYTWRRTRQGEPKTV